MMTTRAEILGGEPHQCDRISQLPDAVLVNILSLLPFNDVVMTSILSKRWKHLWTFCDINLDDSLLGLHHHESSCLQSDHNWRFNAITQILTHNTAAVRCFHVSKSYYDVSPASVLVLDSWIKTVTSRGVKELTIYNNGFIEDYYEVPLSVFQCMSLENLELRDCKLPDSSIVVCLTNLKVLKLWSTYLTDENICKLLPRLSALKRLELLNCKGFRHIQINSATLQTFRLPLTRDYDKDITVEFAPCLENLIIDGYLMTHACLRVIHAPRLQTLGVLNAGTPLLQLGGNSFKTVPEMDVLTDPTHQISSLTKLVLQVDFNQKDEVKVFLELLQCLPCLEILVISVVGYMNRAPCADLGWQFWDQQASAICVDFHLKVILVDGFVGQESEVGFARFIVSRARVLQTMFLICTPATWSPEWEEEKKNNICIENRASIHAVVHLKKGEVYTGKLLDWLVNS